MGELQIYLALGLIVHPEVEQVIEDQEVFLKINKSPTLREESLKVLRDLQNKFKQQISIFYKQ